MQPPFPDQKETNGCPERKSSAEKSANIVLLNIAKGSKKYPSNERQHIVELEVKGPLAGGPLDLK